jgi:outer membrane protein TolC
MTTAVCHFFCANTTGVAFFSADARRDDSLISPPRGGPVLIPAQLQSACNPHKGDAMRIFYCSVTRTSIFLAGLLFAVPLLAEPLPLKRAVELALSHSTLAASATADQQRAAAAYLESRDQYLPQIVAGAGLGESWGFPLSLEGSAPSIFNVNAQSALFNPALRSFVKSAKEDSKAARLQAQDQREQVMQDTVLTYAELVKWQSMLAQLQESEAEAAKAVGLINERVRSGVDSVIDGTKAKLAAAQARLQLAQAKGAADVLREHLSQLTGLSASSIEPVADSIPALPEIKPDDDQLTMAVQSSPAVNAAELRANAQSLRAQGERRGLLPTVDFAAQYAVLARYNNYAEFYNAFERNNATVGVSIRFPFFNPSQHARAQQAEADAVHAKQDVKAAKNQVSEETLRMQRAVEQLAAAQEVADLQYQLAQSNLQSVQVRMNSSNVNIHDLEDARTELNGRYGALQDSNFALEKARIGLLRATGQLPSWLGMKP